MKKFILILTVLTVFAAVCACSSDDSKPYTFKVGNKDAYPGLDAKEIITAAGTSTAFSESGSCGGFEGTDKVYTYSGYKLYTTPYENGDKLVKIEITDDSVSTPDGIKVGSAKAQVISAYGNAGDATDTKLSYTSGGVTLNIMLRDGVVSNIIYTVK